MYKVLLVDDETLNYQLMEKLVNWKAKGFEIVGYAGDGMEAIQKYEELMPDLIFMDIQLPVMDGLECIRCIREVDKEVRIVIISAYGDFAYAQKAIRYGVQDFLLKPVSRIILNQLVDKMQSELSERTKQSAQETLFQNEWTRAWNRYVMNVDEESEQIIQNQRIYGVTIRNLSGMWIDRVLLQEWLQKKGSLITAAVILSDGKMVLASEHEPDFLLQQVLESDHIIQVFPLDEKESVKEQYNIFQQEENPGFYKEENGVYSLKQSSLIPVQDNFQELEKYLLDAIVLNETEELYAYICNTFGKLTTLSIKPTNLKDMVVDILVRVKIVLKRFDAQDSFDLMRNISLEQIRNCQSAKVLGDLVLDKLQATFEELSGAQKKENHRLVFATNAFTEKYYCDSDFSVQKAADYNNLSKNYFMKLYKEQTGMGYWEYVTGLRMERARELLLISDELTSTIGRMVGYESEFHFSRKFKEYCGTSPNAFRKNRTEKE